MEKDQDAGLQLNIFIIVDKSVTLYVLVDLYNVRKSENVDKGFPKTQQDVLSCPKLFTVIEE